MGLASLGQYDDLALGGEGVDLLGVQVDLERRHELVGVGHLALPFHELAHPGQALLVLGRDGVTGLVLPVRGDALFSDAMHLLGADLDFKLVAARRDERGVQRLVEVRPRHGDEVLDAPRHGPPLRVQQAEHRVALGDRVADDADSQQIVDLVDGNLLRGELLLNGIKTLDARLDAGLDAGLVQLVLQGGDDVGEEVLVGARAALPPLRQPGCRRWGRCSGRRGLRAPRAVSPCPAGAPAARRCRGSRGRSSAAFRA